MMILAHTHTQRVHSTGKERGRERDITKDRRYSAHWAKRVRVWVVQEERDKCENWVELTDCSVKVFVVDVLLKLELAFHLSILPLCVSNVCLECCCVTQSITWALSRSHSLSLHILSVLHVCPTERVSTSKCAGKTVRLLLPKRVWTMSSHA